MAKDQDKFTTTIKCPGCEQTGTVWWAEAETRPRPIAGTKRTMLRVSEGFSVKKPVGAPTGFGRAKNGVPQGITRAICVQCGTVQKS
ncbi:MAG TPA: hypothetical protein VHL34_00805 [Rhizomicrobium sp.]|jgi:ribosomal protein S27E|nr:hypothetical protein [Rhizomicrobium sp.]